MPAGVQVFNPDGSLQFDSGAFALVRSVALMTIGPNDGSAPLPSGWNGTPVAMVISSQAGRAVPNINFSGGVVSWNYASIPAIYRATCTILVVAS